MGTAICGLNRTVRPFPRHAVARGPLPRRTEGRSVPNGPGRERKRRSRDPEPGDKCPGVPYKCVLNPALPGSINAVRADKKINVPVVMTREEVAAVISLMDGTAQVVAKLLYGSGLRIIVIIGDMIDKLARMGGAMRLNINHALDRHGSADVTCME